MYNIYVIICAFSTIASAVWCVACVSVHLYFADTLLSYSITSAGGRGTVRDKAQAGAKTHLSPSVYIKQSRFDFVSKNAKLFLKILCFRIHAQIRTLIFVQYFAVSKRSPCPVNAEIKRSSHDQVAVSSPFRLLDVIFS